MQSDGLFASIGLRRPNAGASCVGQAPLVILEVDRRNSVVRLVLKFDDEFFTLKESNSIEIIAAILRMYSKPGVRTKKARGWEEDGSIMSSNISNEVMLIALMTSTSRKEAADKLGISARTIARREETAEFRDLSSGVQWAMVDFAATRGSRALVRGMEKAIELLDSPSEKTQIQAVRLIMQYVPKLIKLQDLDQRVSRLEEILEYELESKEGG